MNSKAYPMKRHPLSALFSRLDLAGDDLSALVEDIKAQGLLSPITTHEGMVLDGWNRYTACELAGVEPVTIELHAGADPWEFVKGSNMLRRHMSPAERVAVLLLKSRMEGVQNCTPQTVTEIEKDLEVSHGTAQKAAQVMKANDSDLTEALADKRVSLDRAAEIAKMPEPERKAALEASPEPKLKPEPKTEPSEDSEALKARIAELESENEDLKDKIAEVSRLMADTQEELDAARRALDAEDLLTQFDKEVKRAQEQSRVVQARNNGLMNENSDLKGRLKSSLRKIEKLQKEAVSLAS